MLIVATVLPLNRQVSPEVEGSDLVQSLRLKIEALTAPLIGAADAKRLSAAPAYQAIYFALDNTLLEDGHALSEYGIQKESELRVVLRRKSPLLRLDIGGTCASADLSILMAVAGSRIAAMFEPVAQGGQPVLGDGLVFVGAGGGGEEPEAGGAVAQLEERQATKALLEEMGEDTRGIDAELAEITARLAEREREYSAVTAAAAEGVPYEEAPPLLLGEDGAYLIYRDGLTWRYILNFLRARQPVFETG